MSDYSSFYESCYAGNYASTYGTYGNPTYSNYTSYATHQTSRSVDNGASGNRASRFFETIGRFSDPPAGRPLKVAHVNAALIPAGIEFWLASLVREVDPNRLRFIRYVATTSFVDPRQIPKMGMPVEVGQKESVQAACRDCDVLMISDAGYNGSAVADWIRECPPRVVVFVAHGDGSYTANSLTHFHGWVDQVVAVSDHVRRTICHSGSATVILNGVDPNRLVQTRARQETRDALGFAPSDFVLGFVGRFAEEKNARLLVNAVSKLPRRYKLLLVGHGGLYHSLSEQCQREVPGRFAILEGDSHLGDLYHAMDAHCLPARLEGYGLVTMEAMMCQVPVIITPCGLGPDLIRDHVNGLIIDPSARAVADAVSYLGENPRLARAIGMEGYLTAQEFGYASRMAHKYEQLFEQLWSDKSCTSVGSARPESQSRKSHGYQP